MSNIPIFLSSDNNYAPFVATTIASICDHTQSFCDFYILDGGITQENQEKICDLKNKFNNFSIEFIKIDLEKEFQNIDYRNNGNWITLATYNRFLIPILKPEIDKAIYSDVDVIVLGDIAEMYNEDLEGYALGAVWEAYIEDTVNKNRKSYLKLPDSHKYFSAGNLLMDCKKWRELNISENLFKIEKKHRNIIKAADMDVLNLYFKNNYKNLSEKYCYINQLCGQLSDSDLIIRHFNGPNKPWFGDQTFYDYDKLLQNTSDFWHYAKLTPFYNDLQKKLNNINQKEMQRKLRLQNTIAKAVTFEK